MINMKSVKSFLTIGYGTAAMIAVLVASQSNAQRGSERGPPNGGSGQQTPTKAMLEACVAKQANDACSSVSANGDTVEGSCFAPQGRPLACVPARGQQNGGSQASGQASGQAGGPPRGESNSGVKISSTPSYTNGILCNYTLGTLNEQVGLASKANWTCVNGQRLLIANGVPEHSVGQFPNPANPNSISEQSVRFVATTSPELYSGPGGRVKEAVMGLNGVKFDPGTGGSCQDDVTDPQQCPLGPGGNGRWNIEALGQDIFDFGEDMNNAHVQPDGSYHYHGVPNGMLSAEAIDGKEMTLIGWAADGFPVYARYGYPKAGVMIGALKLMRPSYRLKQAPDAGRPSPVIIPMGAFMQDWEYVEGIGDLDQCNGRFGSTPEFPEGIYHYYATDAYPYIQRCVKGNINSQPEIRRPEGQRGEGRGRGQGSRGGGQGGRGGGQGGRPPQ